MPPDSPYPAAPKAPEGRPEPVPPWPAEAALKRALGGEIKGLHGRHLGIVQMLVVYSFFGLAVLGVMAALKLFGLFSVSPLSVAVVLLLVLIPLGIRGVRAFIRRSYEEGRAFRETIFHPRDADARVVLLCSLRDAERWRRDPPREHAHFDPEIARVPLALGVTREDRTLAWVGAAAGALVAGTIVYLFSLRPVFESLTVWMILGFAAGGALCLPEAVRPTWVRVVPGRIDVIRDHLLRRGKPELTSIDLRTRRVVITSSAVLVDPVDLPIGQRVPKGTAAHASAVSLAGTYRRRAIREAAFRAAVTRAEAPPLPEDHLLG